MREVLGDDLLPGSDHEFVINLYTVLLDRWPDEEGYRHHLQLIAGRPDRRREVIEGVAASAEARALGVVLRWRDAAAAPAAVPPPAIAPAAAVANTLGTTLAALREAAATMDAAALAEMQRLLAETLAALAAIQAQRMAGQPSGTTPAA